MEVEVEVEVVGGGMKQEVFCKARNFFGNSVQALRDAQKFL